MIGNQATATYHDAADTPRTATSNLVQTTVSQVKSFTLTASGARTAAAGPDGVLPAHHHQHRQRHGHVRAQRPRPRAAPSRTPGLVYYIDADGNGVPDNFTPITTSGPIATAGIFRFVVAGTVPGGTANGPTGHDHRLGDGHHAAPTTLTNIDTTTVANSAVNVTKSLSITSGPSPNAGPITVTLSYTNSGSAAATSLQLRDAIPAGMTYVADSGRWSVTGAGVTLTDADTRRPGRHRLRLQRPTGTASRRPSPPCPAGFSGNVTFQVTVNAGLAPGFVNNTAQYQTTTAGASPTRTRRATRWCRRAAVVANGSTTDSTERHERARDDRLGRRGLHDLVHQRDLEPRQRRRHLRHLARGAGRRGPAGTTFTLLQSDGVTSLIANTTPSIPVYSGGCAAGFETDATNQRCGYRVILRVQLPVSATGGPYSDHQDGDLALRQHEVRHGDRHASRRSPPTRVDLTNNSRRLAAGTPGKARAATGTTVITTNTVTPSTTAPTVTRFQLYVNNTGAINDSFNLAVAGAPGPGWSVVFRADGGAGNCSTVGASLTNTGTINAGANRLVCAEVTVPVTTSGQAAPGNYDLDFTATSALNARGDRREARPRHGERRANA